MIREKLKEKMLADERLKVPMYEELAFWLDQDCQEMIELVNDTNNIAVLLFVPVGKVMQDRLGINLLAASQQKSNQSCVSKVSEDSEVSEVSKDSQDSAWKAVPSVTDCTAGAVGYPSHSSPCLEGSTPPVQNPGASATPLRPSRSLRETIPPVQEQLSSNPPDFLPQAKDKTREEIEFLVNTNKDFYQMDPEVKEAMDLSDTCYAEAAYNMDACFLEWLIRDSLENM